MKNLFRPGRRLPAALGVAVLGATLALTGCQSGPGGAEAGGTGSAVDDGTTVTMWTRSATADFTQSLVDAYNASHQNKVDLTVIPFDAYQQKVGAAAGSKQLPDILSSDVVYAPNYSTKGIFADITGRVQALPYAEDLAPAHVDASTVDGKVYAVPHAMDLSALFYNKKLFTEAGLDPDEPPTSLTELAASAKKISDLGGKKSGYYFGGNCGGCMLFGTWPSVWASGGDVIAPDGKSSVIDNPQAAAVYSLYGQMFEDGSAPADARNENGTTQTGVFQSGNIGMQTLGATALSTLKDTKDLEIGVAPIPGLDGGTSSFIGGDVVGISATSTKADAAWDFISWSISDEAQIEVVAESGNIPARVDLASNKYTTDNPRAELLNSLVAIGRSPKAAGFGVAYLDANGPWLQTVRDAVFGDDSAAALATGSDAITQALQTGS